MQKKLGTRIASGILAALMFAQTVTTTGLTALAVDATSSSNYVVDETQAETSTSTEIVLDEDEAVSGSADSGQNETVSDPNDDTSSGANSDSTAVPVEPTATPVPDDSTSTPDSTEVPATTPEPTAEPSAEPSAQPSAEPSAQPSAEPSASPNPSAEPTATPVPDGENESVTKVKALMEQLPSTIEEIAEYDGEQCTALRKLCDTLMFALAELTDEEAAQFDVGYVDSVYEAVVARMNELSAATPDFTPLAIVEDAGELLQAKVGDEVTMSVALNRDDVAVQYQWQKWYAPEPATVEDAVYDYTDAEGDLTPTWYNYLVGDKKEAELLAENPDASWQGMELWTASRDAFEAIGESADELTFAWKTRNFALDGFAITAEKTEDSVVLFADKDDEHYVASKNDEGAYEFVSTQSSKSATITWENIEGATEASFTHVVEENDRNTMYRCQVTIVDEVYLKQLKAYQNATQEDVVSEDSETADSVKTEETPAATEVPVATTETVEADNTILYSAQKSFELPETMEEFSQKVATRFFSLARIDSNGPALSNDRQWIVGVNNNYEYITAKTYARVQQWLSEGRITQDQADMYWTKLAEGSHTANVIDAQTGLPTGETRQYIGYLLTDGNKMEVLSDWYGETVYFRQAGATGTGTAIEIPASTNVGEAGEQYKSAVTMLSAYISDAGTVYAGGTQSVGSNNYYEDNTHIRLYTVEVNNFNRDPNKYLMDAEGNYRMDSFAWGPGVIDEPDLSGKAFWALKDYIADGYGMMIGHDTMYGYAGAYTDAWKDVNGPWHYYGQDPAGNWHYPGDGCSVVSGQNGYDVHEVTLQNRSGTTTTYHIVPIDPNDTVTRYYNVNSWNPNWGHWNMNALMGENNYNIDTSVNMGTGDYEQYMAYAYEDPYKIPSKIMSSGGSHYAPNYKTVMYGSNLLRVSSYPYSHAEALNRVKYRTPTNYPYDTGGAGTTIQAMATHSNMQVAFGTIWIDYANNSVTAEDGNGKLLTPTVSGRLGTNNFYLAGDGNFLMNQIGHLPENRFTRNEAMILVNTIMFVSQRKQCEVCQSQQDDANMAHFVHRVTSANAKTILTALMQGGNFWYPLDDCYLLTDDINLQAMFGDAWTGIANFNGHWSSDIYTVTLPDNGTPLFLQGDTVGGQCQASEKGKYTTGEANGWNLGSDLTQSVAEVSKAGDPGTRTTGIARIMGTLSELFGTGKSADYAGYRLELRAEDNKSYFSESEVNSGYKIVSYVNSDGKYLMSNVPCIYGSSQVSGSGTMRVRVFDRNGREVTEYGAIRVDVPESFWDTNMTTPLYLGGDFSPRPIDNQATYEALGASFVGSIEYEAQLPASGIKWQWRKGVGYNWQDIDSAEAPWSKNDYTISGPTYSQNEFGDQVTSVTLTFKQCKTAWSGYQFRVVFSDSLRGSCTTYDYYQVGRNNVATNAASAAQEAAQNGGTYKAVYVTGKEGRLTVSPWPGKSTITPEKQEVLAGQSTTNYTAVLTYVLGESGHGLGSNLRVVWQYSENGSTWTDIDWSNTDGHLFRTSNGMVAHSEKQLDVNSAEYKEYDALVNGAASANNVNVYQSTATLSVQNTDTMMSGYMFRAVWKATTHSNTTFSHTGPRATVVVRTPYVQASMQSGSYTDTKNSMDNNVADEHGDWLRAGSFSDQNHVIHSFMNTPTSELNVCDLTAKYDPELNTIHGQTVILNKGQTFSSDTAVYVAVLYSTPGMNIVPTWQYTSFGSTKYQTWNQSVAESISGSSDIRVKTGYQNLGVVSSDSPYYVPEYANRAVTVAYMTITGATNIMDDPENGLRYFFRCYADGSYTTYFQGRENTRKVSGISGKGELVVEYTIDLHHNGFTEDGRNVINANGNVTKLSEAIDAISGHPYSVWSYPDLTVSAPNGLRTVLVQFTSENFDRRDSISWQQGIINGNDENGMPFSINTLGSSFIANYYKDGSQHTSNVEVTVSGNDGKTYVAIFKSDDLIPDNVWEALLRAMQFTTYDIAKGSSPDGSIEQGGTGIMWHVDENRWPSDMIYNSSNGHFYSYVSKYNALGGTITWYEARDYAKAQYNAMLDTYGYLAHITDENEQALVEDLLKDAFGYIGAYRYSGDSSEWYWIDGPDSETTKPFFKDGQLQWGYAKWAPGNPGGTNQAVHYSDDAGGWECVERTHECDGLLIEWGLDGDSQGLRATDHSALDTDVIYTGYEATAFNLVANITGGEKTYDGKPIEPTITITDESGSVRTDWEQYVIVTVSNGTSFHLNEHASCNAVDYGRYTVTLSLDTERINAQGAKILGFAEGSVTEADLIVRSRPLDLVSANNNREYNGTSVAKISNITIQPYNQSSDVSGIVPGDNVALNSTTAYGYYSEYYKPTEYDSSPAEQIHKGDYSIKALTNISLVNNAKGNYYIRSENFTGSIAARPLYLHSLYHDQTKYTYTYDAQAVTIGSGLNLTDQVSYNGQTYKVGDFYEALLAGNRVETDTTRYMGDQYRNYEEDVKEPNNYRIYDSTTDATISNIAIDNVVVGDTVATNRSTYTGKYATANAGETLVNKDSNGDNGTIRPSEGDENRYWWLTENDITRTQDLTLINNNYGDYVIASEDYSGAIYRAGIDAQVKGERLIYGEGLKETPYADKVYTASSTTESWLSLTGLLGNDTLRMDDWTGRYKNEFKYDLLPVEDTPVGDYPITYIGLNEDNFTVLSNYIVNVYDAAFNVTARPILVSVNESLKDYGSENPAFTSQFSYKLSLDDENDWKVVGNDATDNYEDMQLVAGDTVADVIEISDNVGGTTPIEMEDGRSNIPYLSDAGTNSDVIYVDQISEKCEYCSDRDDKDRTHYHLGGYAVWVNENAARGNTLTVKTVTNMYGQEVQNYTLQYQQNILKIHPLSVTIVPDDKEMVYGTTNEPALTYTLVGRRVQWDDLMNVKLVRDSGRDVYDRYVIRVDSYTNGQNYMVDVETGTFKITPAYLMVTPDHHTKYYGDPAPEWKIGITGFKYTDTVDSVFVNGRNAGKVADDGFDYVKAAVGNYTFNVDETSLEMIPNRFGNYNYVITKNPSSLNIVPRPITIEAGGWSKAYGTPDPEHTVLITDELTGKTGTSGTDPNVCVDPETAPITFDLTRADGEDVGVYPIYVSAAEKDKGHDPGCHGEIDGLNTNYKITYIPDNDVIYRADELIGVVSNHTRYYGNAVNNYIEGDADTITYYLGGKEVTPEEAGIISDPDFQHTDRQNSSVGSYAIYATGVKSSKYEITLYPGYVTVVPRPVTVIAQDNEKIYGDSDPTIEFTIHDGHSEDGENYYVGTELTEKVGDDVRVQPEDLQGDVQRQAGEDVGVYDININNVSPYSADGKMNYDIRFVDADFTIKPATLLVQVMGGYKKTYGEENPTFGANITGFKGEDTAETVLTGEVGFATISTVTTNAGKYIVSAKPTIQLEDGKEHRGSNLEVLTNSNGLYNYEIVYIDGDITISPLKLQVEIDHLKKVYASEDPDFTYTMRKMDGSVASVVDPENSPLNLVLTRVPGENVGRGDIVDGEHAGAYTITGTYDNPNYDVEIIDGSLTIVKAIITVTVDGGYQKTYGDPNPEFGVVYDGFIGSEGHPDMTGTGIHDDESVIRGDVVIECVDANGNPVDEKTHTGVYPVRDDKSQLEADNYDFRYVNGDLTITKKPIVVVVDDQEKVYGEEDPPTFTWHLQDPDELVDEDDVRHFDVTTQRPDAGTEAGEQVGEHPITGTVEPTQDYDITVIPGTETITPATIIVTVLPDSKYYGEDNPDTEVTITGYKRGDTIDDIGGESALVISNEAEKWSPVGGGSMVDGKYQVSAKESVFESPNYEIVYIDGTLEVLPLTVRIIVDDAEKVYGTFDPEEFTCHFEVADKDGSPYEASEELLESIRTNLKLTTFRVPGEIVGQYPIKAGYTETDNFIITSVDEGTFTITPAELVITANSAMKVYDGTPLTNNGYKATGLVVNETLGIKDTLESVTVTGSQTEVGTSPNVPSDAVLSLQNGANGNRNYHITYVNGVLEVVPTEQVKVEKNADREITTDGETITYTIKVTNATLHDMTNVQVEDTNNFVGKITIPADAEYSYADGVFTIPSLPCAQNGENTFEIVYTYKVRPDDHGTNENDTLTNKAVITDLTLTDGTEPDPDWFDETPDVDVDIIRHDVEVVKAADKEIATVGDSITYTINVTNTGNVQLNNVVVSDENNFTGDIIPLRSAGSTYNEEDGTWTIAKLGVGVTVTIRYRYVVTDEDMLNLELTNIAKGTIPPSDNIPEIEKPSNEVDVPLIKRSVSIVKSADKNSVYEGDTITYTLHVVNDGTVDLENLTITDESNALGILVPVISEDYGYENGVFTIAHLAVGESVDIQYRYTVVQNDPIIIENVATVHVPEGETGTDTDEPFDVPSNPVEVEVVKDGLTVEKKAAETVVKVGEDIHYTIIVTNTGNTTLHNIVVNDTTSGAGNLVNTSDASITYDAENRTWTYPGELLKGESIAITYTYTTVAADEVAGVVENTAVATGNNPGGNTVPSNPSDEDVTVSETPEAILDVVKSVDKKTAMVGDVLNYTLHITNTGNATAYNAVVKDFFNGVGEPVKTNGNGYTVMEDGNFLIAELAAGESLDITYTYTVQAGDKDVISNIVVVVPEEPPIDIEKEADKTVAAVDEIVTYTITVKNTTDEAKENLTVIDSNNFVGDIDARNGNGYVYNGDHTWTIERLEAGASIQIVYTYTMQNYDASTIVNKADVKYVQNGETVVVESDPVEVIKPVEGNVTIVKSADKKVAYPGDVVTYTVTVHNGKTVDAKNVVVTDANNFAGTITSVEGTGYHFENGQFIVDELKAGASITLHYTYTVEPDDVLTEILKNIATVHVPGTGPDDPDQNVPSNEVDVEVPGDDTETNIPEKGELVVTKTVDKMKAQVGDVLNYTVKVTNTGNAALNNITVSDYFDGNGTLEYIPTAGVLPNGDGTYSIARLPAGASMELHFRYTVVEEDIPMVLNAAVAEPHIPVVPEKSADKQFAKVNEVVTYTIKVTNNDTVAKENLTVSDTNNFKGEISPVEGEGYTYNGDHTWTIAYLPAGETINVVYTYTVQSDDESTLVNDANVKYVEGEGEVTIPTNTVVVEVPDEGTVSILKEADKTIAKPGETITYKVTVHNGKANAVHNVVVTDANNFAGEITGVAGADYRFENGQFIIDTIEPDGNVVLTYTYTVEIADVPTHILENIATAHVPSEIPGEPDEEIPSNPVDVKVPGDETETEVGEGKLDITKTVDKTVANVGDTLQYTITASNIGTAALENVTIEDIFGGHNTLTFVSADEGVVRNADGTFTIATLEEGESKNIYFSYIVAEADAPTVLNTAVVVPETPPVEPEKSADKTVAQVNEVVTYTIKVTNHDDETKTNVLVKDTNNFAGEIVATNGDGYIYNGDHTWTIAELGAGETINIVYTYTVTTEDESVMTNEAKIEYTDKEGTHEIPAEPVDVEKPTPGEVTIVKAADKKQAKPGDVVTYTITLHNDKGFDVHNVEVTDANNFAGQIDGHDGEGYRFVDGKFIIDTLKAGESIVLTYTYTVQPADVLTEVLENIATAFVPGTNPEDPENPGQGIDPNRPIDPDTEIPSNKVEVLVPGDGTETEVETPEIQVSKSVDKTVADVGDTLNYVVAVSNIGKGDAQNVLIKDYFDGHGELKFIEQAGVKDNGDGTYTIAAVPAGTTVELHFTYVVAEADAPKVLNAAVEIPDTNTPVEPTKSADKNVATVDEVITYTITVTNNDNTTKKNLVVNDTSNFTGEIEAADGDGYVYNGDHSWTIAEIQPGETIRIVYTYTVKTEDPSTLLNEAEVRYEEDGKDVVIPTEEVEVEKPVDGEITIVKAADKDVAYPGDTVTYKVTVHNGKAEDVRNVTVTDSNNFSGNIVAVEGAGYHFENGKFVIDEIKAGESVTLTYTYVVEIADVDLQTLINVATAHVPSTDPNVPDEDIPSNEVQVKVPGDETETEIPDGEIIVEKTVDKTTAKVGDVLNYTVKVSNTGNTTQKNILIEDFFDGNGQLQYIPTVGVTVNGDGTYSIAQLPGHMSMELHFTYTVVEGDGPKVLNAAVATPEKPPVEPEKSADKQYAYVDDVVTYTIAVTNTDDEAKQNVVVTDNNNFTGEIEAADGAGYVYNGDRSWTIAEIGAGETIYITYTYTVRAEDESLLTNTAKVEYSEDGENIEIPTNSVDIPVIEPGEVTIHKNADKTIAKPGEVVTYKVTVHNGKSVDVNNVTVSDTNNFAGTIVAVDGADYRYENGQFVIDHIAAGADVVLSYTYTVEIEDVPTEILENIATAHVPGTNPEDPDHPGQGIDPEKPIDPDKEIPSNPVDVEVPGDEVETEIPGNRDLTIVKSADKDSTVPGDIVNYTLTVTNTGEEVLTGVTVVDVFNGHGEINVPHQDGIIYNGNNVWTIEKLAVGAVVEIHYSYTVLAEDADMLINTAVATIPGTNPEDPDHPGQGIDPNRPIDPDKEIPSNKVEIPVVVTDPEDPNPENPDKPVEPTPKPEQPPIFNERDPSKTGVGLIASVLAPAAAISCCAAGLFVFRRKKK